jgi:carboxymethylenebutenolidase
MVIVNFTTSHSTDNLADSFVRKCVFARIEFPLLLIWEGHMKHCARFEPQAAKYSRDSDLAISKIVLVLVSLFALAGCGLHQAHADLRPGHNHSDPASMANAEPATQDWARQRLAKSPRHQEWLKIKYKPAGGSSEREVGAFVVYPEVKNKAMAVIVIHEIFGMSDWVQSLTDQLAEAGYVAIAPDLLSGMGPNGGGTAEIRAQDTNAVGKAIRDLPPDQITADLNAVAGYVANLPASNGKIAVTGYCWGGSQSFRYASNNPKLQGTFVFYGSAPTKEDQKTIDKEALARIKSPVYGFYAGNDARINATLTATVDAMKEVNKKYEPVTYEGAGHGFMRAGDAPAPGADADQKTKDEYTANKKARDDAWIRWKALLAKM